MKYLFSFLLFTPLYLLAQKKPLDHTVYDGWQSIGERLISNNGKWVVYTITPQEGDADLYIQSTDGNNYKKQFARGYNAVITEDSRFAIFKIKPTYKETRDAKIKKKKPEDLPKDSIAIVELGKDAAVKVAKIKGYKTPQKGFGWIAYQKEKELSATKAANSPTQKTVDSLKKTIDSLVMLVTEIKNVKAGTKDGADADEDPATAASATEGSDLVLRNLVSGKEKTFKNVSDYLFSANGQKLVMEITKTAKDSNSKNGVLLLDLAKQKLDTILLGGNDFRNYAFTEDGKRLAFLGERDTATKAPQRSYGVYLYQTGDDSAHLVFDKHSAGMRAGTTVSENGTVSFSKSGNRLFFGTVPVAPLKDTSLVDIDLVKLDIWNYKDDYLQPQQLATLQRDLKRSYLTMYDFNEKNLQPLGSEAFPNMIQTAEGDGATFVAITDTGRRVQQQWGIRQFDVYAVNVANGKKTLVKKNFEGDVMPSSTGKYILLYDNKAKNYFAWDGKSLKNITSKITASLYDEENDVPDDPNPYGIMGWHQNDSAVYVYDRYDIWKVDPTGVKAPVKITNGRNTKTEYRYVKLNDDEKFITANQPLYFRTQNKTSKEIGFASFTLNDLAPAGKVEKGFNNNLLAKAKNASTILYTKESYAQSPVLYYSTGELKQKVHTPSATEDLLYATNPQQAQYNWGTSELYHWTTFNGKQSTGILYKPENFDAKKKYPMIIYFYEKLSDGLYSYQSPAPTPSRLNIPFFVSRGYLVFAPDISYTKGHPGKDAYNYIVSGAKALAKNTWVDAKNIGIQGQSWGGYQVAYLITATPMFKAAWAGAPVVNMFSAYGGIRWGSGLNRQFQYEKTQSRIGATPWQRPDLYIENSPLFNLPKVKTPLVIMANDADDAVPWYQGIEMFTDMRRLGKPVWLLVYNGEAHNLIERKNRKDIQIREQQYFDWLLKGEQPAKWLTEGVPAVKKGKDWGLSLDQQ